MPKASTYELDLLERLRQNDDTASSELFHYCYERVTNKLKRYYPDSDTIVDDCVTDSILNIIESSEKYNPEKLSLIQYLKMDADGDIKNKLKSATNKKAKVVELFKNTGNSIVESPEDNLIAKKQMERYNEILAKHFDNDLDIQLARMILARIRYTEDFVAVLGCENNHNAKIKVKREKDRIKKQIERKKIEEEIKRMLND